jgi:hypothetical protein
MNHERACLYYTSVQLHTGYGNIMTTIPTSASPKGGHDYGHVTLLILLVSILEAAARPGIATAYFASFSVFFDWSSDVFALSLLGSFSSSMICISDQLSAQVNNGSSVLHTLLHVAQWPCVPSGVTSTFAPQSSHFGLAMLSQQANNFKCQVEYRG